MYSVQCLCLHPVCVQCLVAAVWSSGVVVVEYVVVEFVRGALHAVSSSVKNRL